ncbi:MAG: hypothetical protein QXG00_01490 [Candidatus Woesearchaeota archaeon]
MENKKEFYAVLGVAVVAIIAVIYMISVIYGPVSFSDSITGAVVNEPIVSKTPSKPVDVARLFFGAALIVICIGIVYNLYTKNE